MGFINSYKHLEKLCGEVLNNDRCLSAYIDEMINTPNGAYVVPMWNEDLKKLKHYRWVRNKIVHEPNCTEENMCEHGDDKWLDEFYFRIMKKTDPIALYYKATKTRSIRTIRQSQAKSANQTYAYSNAPSKKQNRKKKKKKPLGCLIFAFAIVLLLLAVIYVALK